MTAQALRLFLEQHPGDIAALDEAAQFFNELGLLDAFKTEYLPSSLISWFAESDPEALRERVGSFRYAAAESEGPYEPVSYNRKYRAVIPDGWTGDDADAFAEYVEDSDGVDAYFGELRLAMAASLDAMEEVADQLDESCADLLEFCQQEVLGFAARYDQMKMVLSEARNAAFAGVGAGVVALLVAACTEAGVSGPVILAAVILALVTMVVMFGIQALSVQQKWRDMEADIMTGLNANQLVAGMEAVAPEGNGPIDFE